MGEVLRCSFCSRTSDDPSAKGMSYFKGILSPIICEACARGLAEKVFHKMVDQMTFIDPMKKKDT